MKSNTQVRLRFAPSPTGYLHIGGARTALFNFLWAKQKKGVMVLRIEDTDRERSTQEAVDAILDGLKWLGLTWDEGPFFQTQRLDLYKEKLQFLLDQNFAYRCYCTPEELERMREDLLKQGKKPKYDRRCLGKPVDDSKPHTLRFLVPAGKTVIHDLIKGDVEIDNDEVEDLVIARSDGFPTYNFVVVVDDMDMKITHVIRGDDHLSNTPKQILLGKALGYTIPAFGHLPLILGEDRQRLSKRHGATSVQSYREMGYFPHAIINFLARLGWSHKDQEIFSIEELIEKFDFEHVGKAPGVFNADKLLWLNQHYMKTKSYEEVLQGVEQFIEIPSEKRNEHLKETIESLRDRAKTLDEMAAMAAFYVKPQFTVPAEFIRKHVPSSIVTHLQAFAGVLESLHDFSHDSIAAVIKTFLEEHKLKMKDLGQPLRAILTGAEFSPGIYKVIEIVGKETTLARIRRALDVLAT